MPAPAGRNGDIAPARRSAQSLGRNAMPSRVIPWMKNSRGVAAVMVSATGTALPVAQRQ